MSKIFKYAGVAAFNGSFKVRFSDRNVYAADWVHAVELSTPTTKEAALEVLLGSEFVKNDEQVLAVVKETFDRRSAKVAREAAKAAGVVLKRGRKPKAKVVEAVEAPAEAAAETPATVDADLEAAPF